MLASIPEVRHVLLSAVFCEAEMLVSLWLVLFGGFLVVFYWKKITDYIKQYMRIRTLVNKLSGPPTVPILGNAYNLKWDPVEITYQMEYVFRKYAFNSGDGMLRFWLGPVPIVFLCSSKAVKVLLESHTEVYKPPEYSLLTPIWGDGLITSSGSKWHERRRMITPAFHFSILLSYLHVFNRQAEIMVNLLESKASRGETIDFLPVLRRFSMDTISETAMGVSVNAQKGENEDFYMAITNIFALIFKSLRYPWLWLKPVWYGLGYGFEFDRHVSTVRKLVSKVIAERALEFENLDEKPTFEELTAGRKRKLTFLDMLLSLRKEHKLSKADIMEEVGTFMVAGYDTVSSSIGFVLFTLGHRQHIQDKVYVELRQIFGDSDRAVTADDIKQMKYLEQCMKETIRMYPTVCLIGRRLTEDLIINGHTIPAGVTVSISPFSVARDPQQWKNPECFDPDRFLPENSHGRDPFAYLPFSAGPRNCIGQKFAIMEEKVALAHILRKYRVISMITDEENRGLPEVSLRPSRGFPIRLERRV